MATIINGKEVSAYCRGKIAQESRTLSERGITPKLAVILVGNDPASAVYVKNKQKACIETGIEPLQLTYGEEMSEAELLSVIDNLNADDTVDGILVQLPLPKHIRASEVIARIDPSKDVDAFTYENVGRIVEGKYGFLPCTPAGVMELLKYYSVDPSGKNCVVVGRSNIVGKPMALLLLNANATVTVCHSKTADIASVTRAADILVVAVGRAGFITADMVKEGAVVIDVGINRGEDGKLRGDVDFDGVVDKVGMITPVPGGVGPMTITMLMQNTVNSAKQRLLRTK